MIDNSTFRFLSSVCRTLDSTPVHSDTMHSIRCRVVLDKRPPLPRLVQFALCDNEWAGIDAYRASSVPNTSSGVPIRPPDVHTYHTQACFKMAFVPVISASRPASRSLTVLLIIDNHSSEDGPATH